MTQTIEAIYENGVLRPLRPLKLDENARVTVTVEDDHRAGSIDAASTSSTAEKRSAWELLGSGRPLRSGKDIDTQINKDRDEWDRR